MAAMSAQAVGAALRGDAVALARFGVTIERPPWWRRKLQRRLFPEAYALHVQRKCMDEVAAFLAMRAVDESR